MMLVPQSTPEGGVGGGGLATSMPAPAGDRAGALADGGLSRAPSPAGIRVACPACGKVLEAPASAAGKRAKCPKCGQVMLVPEPVQQVEEVGGQPAPPPPGTAPAPDLSDLLDEEYPIAAGQEAASQPSPEPEDRRPCPMCGELILRTAIKCRYCGEVFDESLRKAEFVAGRSAVDREEIRKFRREMHGLGGFWIFIGALVGVAGLVVAGAGNVPAEAEAIVGTLILLGLAWIALGVFTCVKHMWAVYIGLGLSYVSLLGNTAQLLTGARTSICSILILISVIVQAHRCISAAGRMRRAGIPLTTRV